MSTCSPTEVNDHPATLGVTFGKHFESTSRYGLLGWNYSYELLAAQIPHDGVLAMIPHTGENFSSTGDQTSIVSRCTSTKQHALSRMIMYLDIFTTKGPIINYVSMILAILDPPLPHVRICKIFQTPPPYSYVRFHLFSNIIKC